MSETLLAFKAGRAFRRGNTNFVDADPTKGAIMLTNGDDGLLHFVWKNRTNGNIDEDLILFPTDATFTKVSQSSGRVYVLKFSSSNQRHFFWMQNASAARDEEFARNLDGLLQDPEHELNWSTNDAAAQASSSSSSGPAAGPSSSSGTQFQPQQLADIRATLQRAGYGRAAASSSQAVEDSDDNLALTDVLSAQNLAPLFSNHPDIIPSLFPHLPPDLPMPPSAEVLERVINSTQFKAAAASLDRALRTGLLGGFVRQLGLPEEAGLGVGAFLRAIQQQADRENTSRMDTN